MANQWFKEIYRVITLFIIAIFFGWFLGEVQATVFLAAIGYIFWTLLQLRKIHRWLNSGSDSSPPESVGFLGEICDKLYRLQKDQIKTQAQLEAEVEYLRDSFASLSDAVVMTNAQGLISWCNLSAQRYLGLRLPEDLGVSILNLLRDPSFVAYYENGKYEESLQMPAPLDGDRMLSLEVTRFGRGNRLIFARDITEVHMLEQMRQDFVSNVSHELRTPLTVITGYIDNFSLFADQLPAIQKPLKQMRQHALRMESLLRDLLELSRLETLPNEMHKTVVSLSEMSKGVTEEALAALPEDQSRNITLEVDEGVAVYGNQTELHSALLNLVVNACRYTDNNGEITVRCLRSDGAIFEVADNGMGIDPLQIPRLTERFYRTDLSRSVNTGGTGLGLAIVKRILLRHEAELHINSELNKGSKFSCHFPLHRMVLSE